MTERIEIYGDARSGNCYKLQLACSELGIIYDWHETDVMTGETRQPKFLAINSNGRVPVAKLPDGRYLPESDAILWYLADGSDLVGTDRFASANILRWMFFEQYSHEPYIAVSRFIIKYLGSPPERQAELDARRSGGYAALDVMERELGENDYIANAAYSIADIALYAYTYVAHEGGFELAGYPQIRAWLERIENRARYVPMQA